MQVTGLVLQETFFLPCTRPHLLSSPIWIISWGRIRDVEKKHLTLFLVSQKKEQTKRKPEKKKQGKEVSYQHSNQGRRICSEPIYVVCVCMLSHVCLSATLWAVARQAPLSTGFSRQEYRSGLPFPSPGDFPHPGVEPASLVSPALAGRVFTAEPPGKPCFGPGVHRYPHGHHVSARAPPLWTGHLRLSAAGKATTE